MKRSFTPHQEHGDTTQKLLDEYRIARQRSTETMAARMEQRVSQEDAQNPRIAKLLTDSLNELRAMSLLMEMDFESQVEDILHPTPEAVTIEGKVTVVDLDDEAVSLDEVVTSSVEDELAFQPDVKPLDGEETPDGRQ